MKLRTIITIAFFCVFGVSFGQDYKNDLTSVKTIDNQIQEEQYSTDKVSEVDRLLLTTPMENVSRSDKQFFSRREWRKIKKQLQKNKKRIIGEKNSIHTSKVMDTIYFNVPTQGGESRLSGW